MGSPNNDTIPESTATTRNLVISGKASGSGKVNAFVNGPDDQDWIRVTLRAGETYQFTATAKGASAVDPTLGLRNAAGTLLVLDDDGGPGISSLITFQASTAGTYYLDVGGFDVTTGGYTLTAREVPANTTTFSTLTVGSFVVGDIQSAQDQDFHAVTLVAGQSYIFDATALSAVDPTLALRDAGGQLVADNDGGIGNAARVEFTATTSGTYYLNVGGDAATTGQYGLSGRIDDAADDIGTSDAAVLGGTRSGVIEAAFDDDFYSIQLTAGEKYIFDADGITLTDSVLILYNSAGSAVASNDAGGPFSDARVEFTATTTGTYFLDVRGFGDRTGSYNLAARVDDAADDIFTSDTVAVNASRRGMVNDADDADYFAISLVAGQNYTFDVNGAGSFDATLALLDSNGASLAFDDDTNGVDPQIGWTATYTGTHYLNVEGFGADTGSYTLFG